MQGNPTMNFSSSISNYQKTRVIFKICVIFSVRFVRRKVDKKANLHENWNMQTLVFWTFKPNIIKIDRYNFELYCYMFLYAIKRWRWWWAENAKIGCFAPENVTLQLIQSKCDYWSTLLYGLDACPLNKSDKTVLNQFLMKLSCTSDINIVSESQLMFNFKIPSEQLAQRTDTFYP